MVLVACAGPVRPAAALRDSLLGINLFLPNLPNSTYDRVAGTPTIVCPLHTLLYIEHDAMYHGTHNGVYMHPTSLVH